MSVKDASIGYSTLESPNYFQDMLSLGNADSWVLKLPPRLQAYQNELESLLGKVFSGRPRSRENLELAQQMTMNWCMSKCRKIGINPDESIFG